MDFQQQIALDAGQVTVANAQVDERLVFLRKTYLLVLTGLGVTGVGAYLGAKALLPYVAQYYWLFFIAYIAGFFGVRAMRKVPGLNYVGLFSFTFLCGVILGPLVALAFAVAGGQPTIVIQALVITGTAVTGLSGYVIMTRKDFSFLGGMLSVGVFVLFGAIIVGFFWGSFTFHLVYSIGGAILFCGFILYDTSRIIRTHPVDDPVGAALDLFLDFFLLFMYVLRILVMLAAGRD